MSQFEDLDVVDLSNIADARSLDVMTSEMMYRPRSSEYQPTGLMPEVLASLLHKIGAEGDNPTIAGLLFRLAVEDPTPTEFELYGEQRDAEGYDIGTGINMAAVYLLPGQRPSQEPDALILTTNEWRKPYHGYEKVIVNTWINHAKLDRVGFDDIDELELERNALKRIFTNSPIYGNVSKYGGVFVDQDTLLYRAGAYDPRCDTTDGVTVADYGIDPADYASEYAHGPRKRLADGEVLAEMPDHTELLQAFSGLFVALEPDVEEIDIEGGEHYEYSLDEDELAELIPLVPFIEDCDAITGIALFIEDRPWGEIRWHDDGDYSTNPWGDLVIDLQIVTGLTVTKYKLTVFTDGWQEAYLEKHTNRYVEHGDYVSRIAADLLECDVDPQEAETNLNDIDEFEYSNLCKLVNVMAQCAASTDA